MKRRMVIMAAGMLLAVAAWLLVVSRPWSGGPVYQGRTARAWLGEAATTNQRQAFAAFHEMGTNAVPYLVRELKTKDSAWDHFYEGVYPRLPLKLRTHLPRPLREMVRWEMAEMMAVNVDSRSAMPDFFKLLRDGNERQQFCAIRAALNFAGPDDVKYVPLLVEKLHATNTVLNPLAAITLGRIGPGAKAAIPALTQLLDSLPTENLREAALNALERIDPEAAAKYEGK